MTPLRAGLTCLMLIVVLPRQAEQIDLAIRHPPRAISQNSTASEVRP